MCKFFASVAMALLPLCSVAQYSLTGSVKDAESRQNLTGATVLLNEKQQVTIADELGRFSFTKLPPGTYSVTVKFIGFSDRTESVTLSNDADITIAMQPAAIITDAVVVSATRATDKTPTTYTTISKEKIQQQNFGQDLPLLLNWTPSVVTTSDAGAGVGYTGIRIRGSDPTRVNVTINGIPYNDSESLGTFWVDIPDIAASSQSIQIQRGVGSSTNGAGAFGGTISVQTNQRNDVPYAELINSYGSFNTHKHSLSFGTGLLNNHWVLDGRISKINSDGFIDRASSDLQSYYFSAGFFSGKTMLKAIVFGGKERTYQAWYGVPESRLKNDTEGMMATAADEGWNEIQTANLLNSNSRTFNPYFYKNQVDDYKQDHYQLHFSQQFSSAVTFNAALHLTPGKGYYEEYRFNDSFAKYGIAPVVIGDSTVTSSDLIRRRWLDNKFYGFTYSLNFDKNNWNIIYGGAWNRYDGDHFGEVIWAQVSPVPTEYRYYFNNGDKRDFNNYLKVNYQLGDNFNAYVDLQYRRVTYVIAGIENDQNPVPVNAEFNFFNPKTGVTYSISDRQQLYSSFSVGNREPVRDDFVNFPGSAPKPETLHNLEMGYRGAGRRYSFQGNFYLMNYTNQLVLTGQVNNVGAFIRKNAGESYRMGIELQALVRLSDRLTWNANVTLSKNKIKEYSDVLQDYGDNYDLDPPAVVERKYKNTDISFSPNVIGGSTLSYTPFRRAEVALLTKYVGRQFLDNTSNRERSLNPYFVNDVRLSYGWRPSFVQQITFSLLLNNILNEQYESNGYTWGYLSGSTEHRQNYYFPQAGRNFMAMISIKF